MSTRPPEYPFQCWTVADDAYDTRVGGAATVEQALQIACAVFAAQQSYSPSPSRGVAVLDYSVAPEALGEAPPDEKEQVAYVGTY